MRGPDGTEYPCRGAYLEIVEPERLVFTVGAYDHPADGRTKLTVRNRFESVAVRDAALEMGHAEGTGQSLDRLVELVEQPGFDAKAR